MLYTPDGLFLPGFYAVYLFSILLCCRFSVHSGIVYIEAFLTASCRAENLRIKHIVRHRPDVCNCLKGGCVWHISQKNRRRRRDRLT